MAETSNIPSTSAIAAGLVGWPGPGGPARHVRRPPGPEAGRRCGMLSLLGAGSHGAVPRGARCHCSREAADVAQSCVLAVRPVPGQDDARFHRAASCGVRTDQPPWSQAVRRRSADGNQHGDSGTGGRRRSTRHTVPAREDRSVFADSGCGCERTGCHRPGMLQSC
jgi:hypothetical protein